MTSTVSLEEAQAKLPELIDTLGPGCEVVITKDQQPVARLITERRTGQARPAPGLGKGSILYMAPDFDGPMEEFAEYME